MKRLHLLLCGLCCLGMGFKGFAQTSEHKNAITYKAFFSDFLTAEDRLSNDKFSYLSRNRFLSPGGEIGYYRYLNKSFNLGIPFKMGTSLLKETGYYGKSFASLDADLIFKLNNDFILKENAKVAPYLYAGFGGRKYYRDSSAWDWQLPVGVGINFMVSDDIRFVVALERTNSLTAKRSSLQYQAGFSFLLGKKQDADNDGIADNKDACPTVKGIAAFKGCPDTDGDGITDASDNCPNEAGTVALNGCPDTDADGIANASDNCPTEAGTAALNGCPDTDGDGIANASDNCPTEAGTLALKGCPDSDGDGIANTKDACPNEAGSLALSGCPDADGDGIANSNDKCPDVKGILAFGGCPDTDGDGIQDSEDNCPKEKGDKANKGCPAPTPAPVVITDADGDGIADKDDACATVKGLPAFKGCPDTDGDGIQDSEDRCPTQAGVAANKGCPEIKQADKKVLLEAMGLEFETSSAKFTGSAIATLDKVVEVLNKYPEYKMSVKGFTDNQGSPISNLKLSDARAKACYEYILAKGIKIERISYGGFGESEPIGDNKTAEGRKKNRRVEFIPFM